MPVSKFCLKGEQSILQRENAYIYKDSKGEGGVKYEENLSLSDTQLK